jgi:DNA repair protein RecN (Recombination protein N)
LKNSVQALNQVVKILPDYTSLRDRSQSCLIELKDIADEIDQAQQIVELDQNRTDLVQERLNSLNTLLKKHQASNLSELISIREDLSLKLEQVLNLDDTILKAEKALKLAESHMLENAKLLGQRRTQVVPAIRKLILDRLIDLGIPNASINIEITGISPGPLGTETVAFLFSGNKGVSPQELKNVASGGEFSRLMMVIKYILADKRKLPTIVFDEIDTGVSGEIAIKMGKMMLNMAENHQIIAITHLHQIASSGNAHYFVYKDHSSEKTVSNIKKLTQKERIQEIAHMIGGHNPSDSILRNAKEMITKN